MTLINLSDYQIKAEETTLIGIAKCISCKTEWNAEAPIGVSWLECPKCSLMKGRFKYPVKRTDPHWTCVCDCSLFMINYSGAYCINCGMIFTEFLDP